MRISPIPGGNVVKLPDFLQGFVGVKVNDPHCHSGANEVSDRISV